MGGMKSFEDCCDTLIERGPGRVSPFSLLAVIPNMGAAWLSIELGTRGPLTAPCTACAASQMAIGEGLDAIRLGRAEVMLCGGSDAAITRSGIAGYAAMRALSRRNDDPAAASRPFDADRDGFVMGEAGAILVLEELEHARKREANVYAELLGYGLSSDAEHISEPDPTRPAPGPRDEDGVRGRRHQPRADRLHQRARHLNAARRRERDARDQACAPRGQRPQNAGLLDQGAPPGTASAPPAPSRRSSARSQSTRACCRRRSTIKRQTPYATSTTSPTKPAKPTARSPSPTHSASVGTTPASCCAASTDR
jgi:3-oxoacyl-(acyl-carrier-protein) synthase